MELGYTAARRISRLLQPNTHKAEAASRTTNSQEKGSRMTDSGLLTLRSNKYAKSRREPIKKLAAIKLSLEPGVGSLLKALRITAPKPLPRKLRRISMGLVLQLRMLL